MMINKKMNNRGNTKNRAIEETKTEYGVTEKATKDEDRVKIKAS